MHIFFFTFLSLFGHGMIVTAKHISYDLRDCEMPPGTMDQGVYKCRDNSGCFEMVAICDGRWDCNDGSDEEFDCCTLAVEETNGTHFGCGERMCIPMEKKCDGPVDCFWEHDEYLCTGEERDASKNKGCMQPVLRGWIRTDPAHPDCGHFCGESPQFNIVKTRDCVASRYNKYTKSCQIILDEEEAKKWCFSNISYQQTNPCKHNAPCTITELSHKTAEGDHSSGTLSTFQFGFWTSAADLSFGYCDIGVVGKKKEGTQREKSTVDVFRPNVTCGGPMRLDGTEPGPLRVRINEGSDGWNFDQLNITINNRVKIVYGKGLVWLGDAKDTNVRATEVNVEKVIVIKQY
ncbi:uncharacterized protein LOC142348026 [Convolutriloba macropyga]|uniref:uncharacterized protein LOC142348026 n=1 Tax=Convolutriloba macropyga TaxID=536237 RepID=UPI003F51C4A3